MAGRWTRDDRRWNASFVFWWSAVCVLAGVTGGLLFSAPVESRIIVSGDMLGWDATLAAVSGFLIGAAQAGVLTAYSVAAERNAVRHWLGMMLAWTVMWPARLVATAATGDRSAFILLWQALPWLIFGALSGGWLLAQARCSPQSSPDGDGTLRPLPRQEQGETAPGEALDALHKRLAAFAASDRREAA